jgi:hypothetical protein
VRPDDSGPRAAPWSEDEDDLVQVLVDSQLPRESVCDQSPNRTPAEVNERAATLDLQLLPDGEAAIRAAPARRSRGPRSELAWIRIRMMKSAAKRRVFSISRAARALEATPESVRQWVSEIVRNRRIGAWDDALCHFVGRGGAFEVLKGVPFHSDEVFQHWTMRTAERRPWTGQEQWGLQRIERETEWWDWTNIARQLGRTLIDCATEFRSL